MDGDGADIGEPTELLLQKLRLLGTADEIEASGKFSAAFGGPPQSVAVIEAGATSLSKWWAAGLGGAALAALPAIEEFWNDEPDQQGVLLIGASIVVAALVLAIGYIVGSDVRGRSAAAVATIEARASIAEAMADLAQEAHVPATAAPTPGTSLVVALPALRVRNRSKDGEAEGGWHAILFERSGDKERYQLVKGADHEWVSADEVIFDDATPLPAGGPGPATPAVPPAPAPPTSQGGSS